MILKTNGERLWNSLMEMATIGPGERGGSRRLALTDFDIEGRNLFRNGQMRQAVFFVWTPWEIFSPAEMGKILKRLRYWPEVILTLSHPEEDLTEFSGCLVHLRLSVLLTITELKLNHQSKS